MGTESTTRTRRATGRTGHRPATKSRAAASQAPGAAQQAQTPDDRWQLIEVRAYLLAESRGFEPGRELDDWLQAEREVDSQFGAGTAGPRISE